MSGTMGPNHRKPRYPKAATILPDDGWHWWREHAKAPWRPAFVLVRGGEPSRFVFTLTEGRTYPVRGRGKHGKGEWGPRIEEPAE